MVNVPNNNSKFWLSESVSAPDVLPVGSLAHGLVFSHFNGNLAIMIKSMYTKTALVTIVFTVIGILLQNIIYACFHK